MWVKWKKNGEEEEEDNLLCEYRRPWKNDMWTSLFPFCRDCILAIGFYSPLICVWHNCNRMAILDRRPTQAPERFYKRLQMNLRRDVGNGTSCAQSRFQVPSLAYGAAGIRCSTDPISSTIKSKIELKQSENESDRSEQNQTRMSESERYRYVTCDDEESNDTKKSTGECWSVN